MRYRGEIVITKVFEVRLGDVTPELARRCGRVAARERITVSKPHVPSSPFRA
jgi:hypothetical protein